VTDFSLPEWAPGPEGGLLGHERVRDMKVAAFATGYRLSDSLKAIAPGLTDENKSLHY